MAELAHILVVDDDPSIRRMFQLLLNDTGYRVSTATSGEEALAYLDLVTPDLILMDLMLPGISGQEVTEHIKADHNKPFIPIILVTARGDQKSKVMALDAGADDFLVKPVEFAELLARVRAMLRLQRSQRSLRAEQRKTELLLHLTRELGTTLDLDDLLTHFLDRLADAVGAIRASIILTIEGQPRLFSSTRSTPTTPLSDILHEGLAGWALRERQPVVIVDTREDPRWIATTPYQQMVRSVAVAPIIREERELGAITLAHHTPGYFNAEHLDLLRSVAAQCAIAFQNAELFRLTNSQKEQIERRAEELHRINQMSRHLTELMRPEQLLRLVAHLVHHTLGYHGVSILMRDGVELIVGAAAGYEDSSARVGTRVPAGDGIAGLAIDKQEPIISDSQAGSDAEAPQETDGPPLPPRESGKCAPKLAVPIPTARGVVGALVVENQTDHQFAPNDVTLLSTLASQLGVAFENAQLFHTEQRRVRQLGQVNNLSVAITAQLDSTVNLHIAAAAIATIFEIDHCGIVVRNNARGDIHLATYSDHPVAAGTMLRFPLPTQQIFNTIELHAPQFIPSVADDERLEVVRHLLQRGGVKSLVLAPLTSSGEQIGMIVIDATGRSDQFGRAELTLLETVTSLITQVLENARLYRKVADERSTLNAVLSGATDPILLIDPHDQLLLANRAAQERLGINSSAQQPIESFIAQKDLLNILGHRGNGSSPGLPHEVTLPEGQTFSVSVAPVRGADDSQIGRVAVLRDITAIKELERREQERLRSVFRRYMSPQVAEEVLAGGGEIGEPVERDVVVLFADLRGYTALAEGLEPRVLVNQVLNRYFTAMTEVLYRYGGTIDKFLGDGIVGVFGIPIARNDDVQRSLIAAVDMQRAFAELCRTWRAELNLQIGMGIGIGYGRAVVGNIGSTQRLDYTLIGDVVNTASRLNGMAQPDQIIVSYRFIDALPADWTSPWTLRPIGRVQLKGKQEPHLIYEIEYEETEEGR